MRLTQAGIAAGLALGLMSGTAKASYVYTFSQTAAGVLETGAGSLNVVGLNLDSETYETPFVAPAFASTDVGAAAVQDLYDASFFSSPAFGTGGFTDPNTSSGPLVGFAAAVDGIVAVPEGYTSGSLTGSSALYAGATFQSLGLTPGTYTYSYTFAGNNDDDSRVPDIIPILDTITVQVGTVPLPASAPMFGAVGYGLKRKAAAA